MKIIIWGTGNKTLELHKYMMGGNIVAYVQSHPRSSHFGGRPILSPQFLIDTDFDVVIVAVSMARDIEKEIITNFSFLMPKCVFLYLWNLEYPYIFYYQYRLLAGIVTKEYILSCSRHWQNEMFRCDYRVLVRQNNSYHDEGLLMRYAAKDGIVRRMNYPFHDKYMAQKHDIELSSSGMYYVIYHGRHVFFPKGWSRKRVLCYWSHRLEEHDIASPLNTSAALSVPSGSSLLEISNDIPLWALDNIETATNIYLCNPAQEWLAAWKETFSDADCRVQFFVDPQSIADFHEKNIWCNIRLEEGVQQYIDALYGTTQVKGITIATYYHENDYEVLHRYLGSKHDRVYSTGDIYYPYNEKFIGVLTFRPGMIVAVG